MRFGLPLLAWLAMLPLAVFAQSGALTWNRIAGGGGMSQSAGWQLSGTIGQSVAISGGSLSAGFWAQAGPALATPAVPVLASASRLDGPTAGADGVILAVGASYGVWTAVANDPWLHVNPANTSGVGSTNVLFSFDANPGDTRTGTLTVAGLTLTVTQAGSAYVPASPLVTLANGASGLNQPFGVTVDGTGNVYIADPGNVAVYGLAYGSSSLVTLANNSTGLSAPYGVASDLAGDVYIADLGNRVIDEIPDAAAALTPSSGGSEGGSGGGGVTLGGGGGLSPAEPALVTLVSSGLSQPWGVAVDLSSNVYIADANNQAVYEFPQGGTNIITLANSASGLNRPRGVAVDALGNVYISDSDNRSVYELPNGSTNLVTLANNATGLNFPWGVAVDGAGNVYIADAGQAMVFELPAGNANLVTLANGNSGLNQPRGVAVDAAGNIYIADNGTHSVYELPHAYVAPTLKVEAAAAGTDTLPVVVPATANLSGPFAPTTDSAWLTVNGVENGVVSFSFAADNGIDRVGHIYVLGQTNTVTQGGVPLLGVASRLDGPAAGADSVALSVGATYGTWTAVANDIWLHVNPACTNGIGSTNVLFSLDANPGDTRTGTLTVAGLTLTVTQAGAPYVAASPLITLATTPSGVNQPFGVAVDGTGNLFVADPGNVSVYELPAGSTNLTILANSASGMSGPYGVAVDGAGDTYITDPNSRQVYELPEGGVLTNLNLPGLSYNSGVAVDGSGNLYIADVNSRALYEVPNGGTGELTLANDTTGLSRPRGVAVDVAGNLYIADADDSAVYELPNESSTLITLANNASGLGYPYGVTVDGAGNVYIADPNRDSVFEIAAGTTNLVTVANNASGLGNPLGVAVDSAGNAYITDNSRRSIFELPHTYVAPVVKVEAAAAGTDALPAVVPATANLTGPFAPTTDSSWLTVNGVNHGVVSFSFTADNGIDRVGHIYVLGQTNTIQQGGIPLLGASSRLDGPAAGTDSVALSVGSTFGTWTAAANNSWLHVNPASTSGIGSTNVLFSLDANPGDTRSGTLTVAGLTLTVTQAGSTYVAASPLVALASTPSGVNQPYGVAVDGMGNVFAADLGNNSVYEIPYGSTNLTILANNSSGVSSPIAVAVDGMGDEYVSDTGFRSIFEFPAGGSLTNLNVPGLSYPSGVAVDGSGNIYVADVNSRSLYELPSGGTGEITLSGYPTGVSHPRRVAVDVAGNLYIADDDNGSVYELPNGSGNLITLANNATGLSFVWGVAVDGGGNVYMADANQRSVFELAAGSTNLVTLASTASGLNVPVGLAVDAADNVYIGDVNNHAVYELPHAYVAPTVKVEAAVAGTDTLPVVMPATANLTGPFVPTTDSAWLTINGITNGIVTFAFTADNSIDRIGHIYVLGQTNTIEQGGIPLLGASLRLDGPSAGTDSVVLSVGSTFGTWTATANANWLHVCPANASGVGNTNVLFSLDANLGDTRTGTLTVAGLTLTVTQAGSAYVAASPLTTLATSASGLENPVGMAVDGARNLYIADPGVSKVFELPYGMTNLTTLANNGSVASPDGVAVDGSGNLWIGDQGYHSILELPAGGVVTNLLPEFDYPEGIAMDGSGNIYVADVNRRAVYEQPVGGTGLLTLASYPNGLNRPRGVAVDAAGNVYVADSDNRAVYEQYNGTANLLTVASTATGLGNPYGIAVDGAGDVYVADPGFGSVFEMSAGSTNLTTLASGLGNVEGVTADALGDVYISDIDRRAVYELPHAFVAPTVKVEAAAAGTDTLPVVVPSNANLTGPFVPTTDSAWLTINGITNGVVTFAFTADNGIDRVGHIYVLGQTNTIEQGGVPLLGASLRLDGPAAGTDSVVLSVGSTFGTWTAVANDPWLHVNPANTSGVGNTNILFSLDANPGDPRTGTLTVAGLTLTVTQAGSAYVAASPLTALVTSASGLGNPYGVAVDGARNLYIADLSLQKIVELPYGMTNLTTLANNGSVASPDALAVDGSGNLWIGDQGYHSILELPAGGVVTNLLPEFDFPEGVAVDGSENIYVADINRRVVYEQPLGGTSLLTLASYPNGLNRPRGVAVDAAGNVYVADSDNRAVYEQYNGGTNLLTSASAATGLGNPYGIAVDGAGDVYIADPGFGSVFELPAGSTNLTTLASGLGDSQGVAVDALGDVYISGVDRRAVYELPHAYVAPTVEVEAAAAGNDSLPPVVPANANLTGPFAPTTDSAWLTINGVANGIVNFSFTANNGISRTAHIYVLGQTNTITQGGVPLLGTSLRVDGPAAGTDSVVLSVGTAFGTWMAVANDSWLHVSQAAASGMGSTNVLFSLDANPGATRTGTLTIAGLTLTVTQAGGSYVAASPFTPLVTPASGLQDPFGLSLDRAGNLYIADPGSQKVFELPYGQTNLTTLANNSSGLNQPYGLAVDGTGDVFAGDLGYHGVLELPVGGVVTNLGLPGVNAPQAVAVDGSGNIYIADEGNRAVYEMPSGGSGVLTLASYPQVNRPRGVAVDAAGNVYIADAEGGTVYEMLNGSSTLITLANNTMGVNYPNSVAVDGAGNVYIADPGTGSVYELAAGSTNLTTLANNASGLSNPQSVAVDAAGNVYVGSVNNHTVYELPHTFVDTTAKVEAASAGVDALPVVVAAATANLNAPFAPTTDSAWLAVSGITNGVVSFAFSANGSTSRTGHIDLLGQSIAITQSLPVLLGSASLVEGPAAGGDSVIVSPEIASGAWTAATNVSWLHLSSAYQSGTGSTNLAFTFDANTGVTRAGAVIVAGQPVTITQAGSTYTTTNSVTTLVASGLNVPRGVAVDAAGNVYIADLDDNAIKKWSAANNSVTTLVSSGIGTPFGVAVDASGNVYFSDQSNLAIKEWQTNGTVTTLVSSGISSPKGVAVDGSGNVYFADNSANTIKEWLAASGTVSNLVASGLSAPRGVAVDAAGNVYIADTSNKAIKMWSPASKTVTTLVSSGLTMPYGVAVDGGGSVFIVDGSANTIKKWSAVSNSVLTLVSSGLNTPYGVAVDAADNVYIGDSGSSTIKEQPRAFVDTAPITEYAPAGQDILPVVLPVTENLLTPFAPASDSTWLTFNGVTNDVVTFAFTANGSTNRTANVSLLGETVAILQLSAANGTLAASQIPTNSASRPFGPAGIAVSAGGAVSLNFTGHPGCQYWLERSADLVHWTTIWSTIAPASGGFNYTDNFSDLGGVVPGTAFYRLSCHAP